MAANVLGSQSIRGKRAANSTTRVTSRKSKKKPAKSKGEQSAVLSSVTFSRKQKRNAVTGSAARQDVLSLACNECSEMFANEVDLEAHKTAHHSVLVIYQCPSCPSTFNTSHELEVHVNQHTLEGLQDDIDSADTEWFTYSSSDNTWVQHQITAKPDKHNAKERRFSLKHNLAEKGTQLEKAEQLEYSNNTNHIAAEADDGQVCQHYCCICGREYSSPERLLVHKISKHPTIHHHGCESCSAGNTVSASLPTYRNQKCSASVSGQHCPVCGADDIHNLHLHLNESHGASESESADSDSESKEKLRTLKNNSKPKKRISQGDHVESESKRKLPRAGHSQDHAVLHTPEQVKRKTKTKSRTVSLLDNQITQQSHSHLPEPNTKVKAKTVAKTGTKTSLPQTKETVKTSVGMKGDHSVNGKQMQTNHTDYSPKTSSHTYRCPLCTMAFSLSSELLQHMSTHSGYKDYIERCASVYASDTASA